LILFKVSAIFALPVACPLQWNCIFPCRFEKGTQHLTAMSWPHHTGSLNYAISKFSYALISITKLPFQSSTLWVPITVYLQVSSGTWRLNCSLTRAENSNIYTTLKGENGYELAINRKQFQKATF